MKHFPVLAAAVLLAAPGAAQQAQPSPTLEHRMLLRCSAAFALVANRQAAGDAEALRFPPLDVRGKEYFARASARVMDEAHLDRAEIAQALETEARALVQGGGLAAIMPVCLSALEASEK